MLYVNLYSKIVFYISFLNFFYIFYLAYVISAFGTRGCSGSQVKKEYRARSEFAASGKFSILRIQDTYMKRVIQRSTKSPGQLQVCLP